MSYEYMMGLGALGANGGGQRKGGQRGRRDPQKGKELWQTACGGGGCPDSSLNKKVAIKTSLQNSAQKIAQATGAGCQLLCEEGDHAFLCCPPEFKLAGGQRRQGGGQGPGEQGPGEQLPEEEILLEEDMDLMDPSVMPVLPPEEPSSPWGAIAVLGILGLGVFGIAGYFLWWRDTDEEEETTDDDQVIDEDEVVVEDEEVIEEDEDEE